MSFYIGQKVASVKNASKVGVILEVGLPNDKGVPWVRVRYGKQGQGKWTLSDGIRPYQVSRSIAVPDGVVVRVRPGKPPELFQQPESTASHGECETFLAKIHAMFLLHGRQTVV
jgi:hypothetical protein